MFGLPNSLLQIGVELFDFHNVHWDLSALCVARDSDAGIPNSAGDYPGNMWSMVRDGSWHGAVADDLRRHARHGHVVRHRLEHHRSRRDARAVADLDIADDAGARADQHAVADLRMAVAVILAGAAERDAVQHRDVVADHRGLADHEAGGVIEEDAAADLGGRMDVALEHRRRAALQVIGEVLAALVPQPVRQPVGLDGVEALVVEHRLDEAVGRRIAVEHRDDVGAERLADLRLVLQRVGIGLPDQFGRDVGMVEPLADAMHHRRLQRVVVQDRGIDEGADLGLAADHVLGLVADLGPDRIDLLDRRLRTCECCCAMDRLSRLRGRGSSTGRTAARQPQRLTGMTSI